MSAVGSGGKSPSAEFDYLYDFLPDVPSESDVKSLEPAALRTAFERSLDELLTNGRAAISVAAFKATDDGRAVEPYKVLNGRIGQFMTFAGDQISPEYLVKVVLPKVVQSGIWASVAKPNQIHGSATAASAASQLDTPALAGSVAGSASQPTTAPSAAPTQSAANAEPAGANSQKNPDAPAAGLNPDPANADLGPRPAASASEAVVEPNVSEEGALVFWRDKDALFVRHHEALRALITQIEWLNEKVATTGVFTQMQADKAVHIGNRYKALSDEIRKLETVYNQSAEDPRFIKEAGFETLRFLISHLELEFIKFSQKFDEFTERVEAAAKRDDAARFELDAYLTGTVPVFLTYEDQLRQLEDTGVKQDRKLTSQQRSQVTDIRDAAQCTMDYLGRRGCSEMPAARKIYEAHERIKAKSKALLGFDQVFVPRPSLSHAALSGLKVEQMPQPVAAATSAAAASAPPVTTNEETLLQSNFRSQLAEAQSRIKLASSAPVNSAAAPATAAAASAGKAPAKGSVFAKWAASSKQPETAAAPAPAKKAFKFNVDTSAAAASSAAAAADPAASTATEDEIRARNIAKLQKLGARFAS